MFWALAKVTDSLNKISSCVEEIGVTLANTGGVTSKISGPIYTLSK